jgi:hypothetical protein
MEEGISGIDDKVEELLHSDSNNEKKSLPQHSRLLGHG